MEIIPPPANFTDFNIALKNKFCDRMHGLFEADDDFPDYPNRFF
jgi:hypothetical protein